MLARGTIRIAVLFSVLLKPLEAGAEALSLEYAVKAEFIERFTSFIDWPNHVFPDADGPFVMCFVGSEDPIAEFIADLAKNRRVKGRRPVFAHIDRLSAL